MARPHIGITTSYEDGKQQISHYYIRAIEQSGGLPIIVPMLESKETAQAFAELLDGLVITGGPGIVKGLVGELPDDIEQVDPVRDTSDTLIYESIKDKPVFGICYGMQFINAQAGGTLYADVEKQHQGAIIHSTGRGATTHSLTLDDSAYITQVMGKPDWAINTYHIQAIAEVGSGLKAVGYGPDGVIEAIESEDHRLIGVQFHPERMYDEMKPLFEDFVARCKNA